MGIATHKSPIFYLRRNASIKKSMASKANSTPPITAMKGENWTNKADACPIIPSIKPVGRFIVEVVYIEIYMPACRN
jgi:hypothetical protein